VLLIFHLPGNSRAGSKRTIGKIDEVQPLMRIAIPQLLEPKLSCPIRMSPVKKPEMRVSFLSGAFTSVAGKKGKAKTSHTCGTLPTGLQ
jgi:hypothetical protein